MALTNQIPTFTPMPPVRWPDPVTIDPADILLGYDPYADSLSVAFGGIVRPAIIDCIDGEAGDYVSLRIDAKSEDDVVGIEIENVRDALAKHPTWRPVVEAAPSEPGMQRADSSVWPALTAFVADVVQLWQQGTQTSNSADG